jgi:ribosome-associated protein
MVLCMAKARRVTKTKPRKDGSEQISESAVNGILEKKGHDAVTLDLRELQNSVADFFVVCHGDSNTQVEAIARSVEDEVEQETGERPLFREGLQNAEWVVLDYFTVVVHIFLKEKRDFYGIERFWADAAVTKAG